MNSSQFPNRPPPGMGQQKVRVSQSATFMRFIAGGLGYGAIDVVSKLIFGEGNHGAVREAPKKIESNGSADVQFSKEKLSELVDKNALQEVTGVKEAAAPDSAMKNVIFGFISSNFSGVFHAKLNGLFRRRNYSASYKMALSPFTFLPYYIFCGLYDHLPFDELITRIAKDALPLLVVRATGDLLRFKLFSKQEQAAITQGAQFMNNSPRLLAFHLVCRGTYIFAIDTLYHQRVQLF